MGQVSNESQRPTSQRRQRARRGPDARRRGTGATPTTRPTTQPGSGNDGAERFVAGERQDPIPHTAASRRPATDTGNSAQGASATPVADGGRRRGGRKRLADWWAVWGPHIRRFAPTVLVGHAVTLAVAIALAVIIGIGETFTAVPAMVGTFWMMANLAPVQFTGAELGIVPLLPAALVILVHSRRVRASCGTQITVRNIRVFAALAVLVPMILTGLAWLVLWDASNVFAVGPPNIFVALVATALVNGFAFVIGLGPKIWRALLLRRGWPTWPVESAALAGKFVKWLLVAGFVVVLVQLLINVSALADAYSIAPDVWGRIGLTVIAVLYLPNLVVGAAGVLAGSEMHIGDASASLFAVTNANLPPLPVLAAMPNSELPFGEVLLIVPAVIGLLVVHRYFAVRTFVEAPVFTALGAGVFAGVVGLLASLAAGGTLGVYGSAGPLVWLTPLVFACWIAVPALVVFAWATRRGARVTETADTEPAAAGPEPAEDAEPAEESDSGSGGTTEDAVDVDAEDVPVDDSDDSAEDADAEDAEDAADAAVESGADADGDPADAADEDDTDDTDGTDGADGESTK